MLMLSPCGRENKKELKKNYTLTIHSQRHVVMNTPKWEKKHADNVSPFQHHVHSNDSSRSKTRFPQNGFLGWIPRNKTEIKRRNAVWPEKRFCQIINQILMVSTTELNFLLMQIFWNMRYCMTWAPDNSVITLLVQLWQKI